MKMITIANPKGGSGKTTTAVELSSLLALQGKNILLIDLDPRQDALSACQTKPENLIVASDLGEVAPVYDFIFVDTPTEKNDATQKALSLSDAVLIPADFSMAAIRVAKQFAEELSIPYWVMATHFRHRTRFGRDYLLMSENQFGEHWLNAPIHSSVKFAEAAAQGTPFSLMEKTVETPSRALEDYRKLAELLVQAAATTPVRPKDLSIFYTPNPARSPHREETGPEEGVDLNEFDSLMKDI